MSGQFLYLFGLFKSVPKELAKKSCNIDNHVFKLHYKYSLSFLSISCLLTLGTQFFGFNIRCYASNDYYINNLLTILNVYCWQHATFSFSDSWNKKVGTEVAYPGVSTGTENSEKVFHSYYRWITFVLSLQAILFYVSRYVWEKIENETIYFLSSEFKPNCKDDEECRSMRSKVVNYLFMTKGLHNEKFWKFCLLEIFNLINVLAQIIFMDRFFKGEFRLFGWKVISFINYGWDLRFDPMIKIFPRMTKCTFHYFGPSSDISQLDALCMLPINIINEKIYVFLWFWFCILLIFTLLGLIHRLLTILVFKFRVWAIKWECSSVNCRIMKKLINKIDIGDWFILHLLSKNMDKKQFKYLIEEMSRKYSINWEKIADKNI